MHVTCPLLNSDPVNATKVASLAYTSSNTRSQLILDNRIQSNHDQRTHPRRKARRERPRILVVELDRLRLAVGL